MTHGSRRALLTALSLFLLSCSAEERSHTASGVIVDEKDRGLSNVYVITNVLNVCATIGGKVSSINNTSYVVTDSAGRFAINARGTTSRDPFCGDIEFRNQACKYGYGCRYIGSGAGRIVLKQDGDRNFPMFTPEHVRHAVLSGCPEKGGEVTRSTATWSSSRRLVAHMSCTNNFEPMIRVEHPEAAGWLKVVVPDQTMTSPLSLSSDLVNNRFYNGKFHDGTFRIEFSSGARFAENSPANKGRFRVYLFPLEKIDGVLRPIGGITWGTELVQEAGETKPIAFQPEGFAAELWDELIEDGAKAIPAQLKRVLTVGAPGVTTFVGHHVQNYPKNYTISYKGPKSSAVVDGVTKLMAARGISPLTKPYRYPVTDQFLGPESTATIVSFAVAISSIPNILTELRAVAPVNNERLSVVFDKGIVGAMVDIKSDMAKTTNKKELAIGKAKLEMCQEARKYLAINTRTGTAELNIVVLDTPQ
jgi:hypothetical protein